MDLPSPIPKESVTSKLHRVASDLGMVAISIIEGAWTALRTRVVALWHWSAKWRWFDGILGVGFAVSLGIHEYWIAILCLILCAFSSISIVWHEARSGLFIKSLWTVFI